MYSLGSHDKQPIEVNYSGEDSSKKTYVPDSLTELLVNLTFIDKPSMRIL